MRSLTYSFPLLSMFPTQTFFIGTIGEQLGDQQFVSDKAPFVNAYSVIAPAAVVANGAFGAIMTHLGSTVAIAAVTAWCTLSCALLLLRNGAAFAAAEVCNAFGRCWLFAYFYARIFAFGSHYGVLVAWPQVVLGVCGFAMEPLAAWAKGTCNVKESDPLTCSRGHWHALNWVQLACVASVCLMYLAAERRRVQLKGAESVSE